MTSPQSKAAAVAAFRTVLRGITPAAGYHFDLSQRVYSTLQVPENPPFTPTTGERWVYVCVPLVDDRPAYVDEGSVLHRRFSLHCFCFSAETVYDRSSTTESDDLAYLEDDLVRAIRKDDTLAYAVEWCKPSASSKGCVTGWPVDGKRYGEMELSFELSQVVE